MSTLSVTTITTENATTPLRLQTGNSSGPAIVLSSSNTDITLSGNFRSNNLVISTANGTVASPAISNQFSPNTGIYFPAANTIGFVEGGVEAARIDANANMTVVGTVSMGSSFMRNRIINGAMDIAQRGTSFANQSAYSLDRWFTNRNGGASGVTFYQAYAAFGTKKNWMTIQRAAGNTDTASAVMYQAIEGINSRDLAGQTVTVSFTVGTGSTLSSTTDNVSTNIYYQTTGTDIGPNGSWTTLSTISWSVPSNTGPTRYIAQFSIPATATQLELVIGFQFAGTAGADDRYYVTEVQLEPGSIATPFERRQYGQELALCQRYFYKSFSQNIGAAAVDAFRGVVSSSGFRTSHSLKHAVTMRTAPTIVVYNPATGAAGSARNEDAATNVTPTVYTSTIEGMSGVDVSGSSSGQCITLSYTASAEL